MFGNKNVGSTVKAIASILLLLAIGASLVIGIIMLTKENYYGFLVIGAGVIGSYIITYLIHSLGYLIEKIEGFEAERAKEKEERERIEKEEKESREHGFCGIDVDDKNEIDELVALKKDGKISEDEFNERFVALMKKQQQEDNPSA